MNIIQISNASRSLPSSLRAQYCDSFMCRLRGMMFRDHLDEDGGLLLVQKNENRRDAAIHMFFVKMDLGIVWLNSEQQVVDCQLAKRWRPFYQPALPAKYVLEINPGWLEYFQIGDKLKFEDIHSI